MNEDKSAVEAVRQGDRDRFAELVERHKRMVYGIAWSYLGNADICEDAAQETFIKAYRYLGALRDPERFSAWLSRIARNVSTTIPRKRSHELENMRRWQAEQPMATAAPGDAESDENIKVMLRRNLEALAPRHRECLVLFYMEGKSIRETAAALGLSEEAVKTRLHRARRVLRGRLETEIEQELKGLEPRKNFTASVMLILPQSNLLKLGAGGGMTLLSKAAGWLGNIASMLAFAFWMVLAQTAFFYFFMRWFVGLEVKNLIDKPENEFRKALIRRNITTVSIVVLFVFIYTQFAMAAFGYYTFYQVLAVYCAWGTYKSVRILRVNRSPFILGQTLAIFTFLVTSILMGLGAPPVTFFLALALLNLVVASTNRKMPRRQDYNLFLRQIQGGLGQPRPEHEAGRQATQSELRAFARFLGEHWLIRDYSAKGSAILMRLPPVRMSPMNSFLMSTVGDSFIRIVDGGEVQAFLSRADAKAIRKLTDAHFDEDELSNAVEPVVQNALTLFLEGRHDEARALLSTVRDEEIFVSDFGKTRAYKLQIAVPIICAVLLLVLTMSTGQWRWGASYPFSRWGGTPVSKSMAREAIDEWLQEDRLAARADFLELWSGPAHPSLSLIGSENVDAYKIVVAKELKMEFDEQAEGAIEARIINALLRPSLLYHAVETPLLTSRELAELGFTPNNVRMTLADTTDEQRAQLFNIRHTSFQRGNDHTAESYRILYLQTIAKRLAVLHFFGALDFVDADRIAGEIASYQVDDDFRLPNDFIAVDLNLVQGLFHTGRCGLVETWAALHTLALLNRLDAIDREACIEAILRFYEGDGVFKAKRPMRSGIMISGKDEDAFYAMESLALLGVLDRIQDFSHWKFQPLTQTRTVNHQTSPGHVTGKSLQVWAYRERLGYYMKLWEKSMLAHTKTGSVSTGFSETTSSPT